MATALATGYRLIDTAAAYGNEREVGQAIRRSVVPAVNQVEVHPYFTQPAVQAANAARRVLTQAWSPIGGITSYRGTEALTHLAFYAGWPSGMAALTQLKTITADTGSGASG